MVRVTAAGLIVGMVLAACSTQAGVDSATGDPRAIAVLAQAAQSLDGLQSAVIDLRLMARARAGDQTRAGFEMSGPLALRDDRSVQDAALSYTQLAGSQEATAMFTAVDGEFWVEVDGTAYTLPDEQAARFGGGGNGIDELDITDWFRAATVTDDGSVATVSGGLDVVAAYADLAAFADLPALPAAEAERLAAAARQSRITVEVDTATGELRVVDAEVVFGPEVPQDVPAVAAGAVVTFRLALSDIGEPVQIQPPSDPRPLEELPSAQG